MTAIAGISIKTVLMFGFLIATQIGGTSMLPMTNGFRNVGWTLACLGTYAASFFVMAEIIRQGMPMSLLIPLIAALLPLVMIAVGIVVYGESASLPKIAFLIVACVAVGIASALN